MAHIEGVPTLNGEGAASRETLPSEIRFPTQQEYICKGDLAAYSDNLFKYASDGVHIAHRAYTEGQSSHCLHRTTTCIGHGDLIADAIAAASIAANYQRPAVYCQPLAGFRTGTEATEAVRTPAMLSP